MSSKPEPLIWSCDTGQQITCFVRSQLTITWLPNIKDVRCRPRLYASVELLAGVWPPCCAKRPRSMPLAMVTMKKELHVVLFLKLWFLTLRPFVAPELCYLRISSCNSNHKIEKKWCIGGERENTNLLTALSSVLYTCCQFKYSLWDLSGKYLT